jgi:hypothetical protein
MRFVHHEPPRLTHGDAPSCSITLSYADVRPTVCLARPVAALQGTPGDAFSGCSGQSRENGHSIYLIKQGIIHNTRVARSPVGTQRDVQVAAELYTEEWWLEGLAAKNLSAVWQRHYFPHNCALPFCSSHTRPGTLKAFAFTHSLQLQQSPRATSALPRTQISPPPPPPPLHDEHVFADEITAFEAYLDLYILTGRQLFLDAVEGAWGMFRDHWIHVGGSQAINEGR